MSAPQPGTPLPWRTEIDNVFAGPDNNSTYVADCAPMGGPVEGRPEQVANAAYIVHACNNYPKAQAMADALRLVRNNNRNSVTGLDARKAWQDANDAITAWDAKP